jgi:hypothetical protein
VRQLQVQHVQLSIDYKCWMYSSFSAHVDEKNKMILVLDVVLKYCCKVLLKKIAHLVLK